MDREDQVISKIFAMKTIAVVGVLVLAIVTEHTPKV